jgi:hypothetical protein
MPDPRLISRAQRAATMLEKAWDRWRAVHDLAPEPLPPVSSYVGYSIEEPWGRPRVVFGVDAADAEKLATLLQDCAAPQRALEEARARIPAQGRAAGVNGARGPGSDAVREESAAVQAAGSVNGFHPVETAERPGDQVDPDHVPEGGTADFAVGGDGTADFAVGGDGSADFAVGGDGSADFAVGGDGSADFAVGGDGTGDTAASDPAMADAPVSAPDDDLDGPADQDGLATPDVSGRDQEEAAAGMDDGEPGEDSDPQAVSDTDDSADTDPADTDPTDTDPTDDPTDTDDPRDAGHGVAEAVAETMAAELAGWAAGELPGQASARLAAWATVSGATARSGRDADLRTGGDAAERVR